MVKAPLDPALAQLRDIHWPKPIGFWPLAPGWYLLLLLFLLGAFAAYRGYRRNSVKRSALAMLSEYQKQYDNNANAQDIAAQISDVLRRVVLVYFPRNEVAGLQGKAWVDFLNKTSKGIDFMAVRKLLTEMPYAQKTAMVDLTPLFAAAKAWIQQRGGHV